MINLMVSVLIVISSAAVCFELLSFLGMAKELAGGLAGSVFAAITYVHNLLEKRELKPNLFLVPKTIVSMEDYTLHWYIMIVYSSMLYISVIGFVSFYAGFIFTIGKINMSHILLVLIIFPFIIIASYFIGKWIGNRCDKYGIIIIIVSVIVARIFWSAIDLYLSEEAFVLIFGEAKSLKFIIEQIIVALLLFGVIALFGYWRGKKIRLAKYIGSLLSLLPPETQNAIVNLTYEEAKIIKENDKLRRRLSKEDKDETKP